MFILSSVLFHLFSYHTSALRTLISFADLVCYIKGKGKGFPVTIYCDHTLRPQHPTSSTLHKLMGHDTEGFFSVVF
jgi:hypothetical protein